MMLCNNCGAELKAGAKFCPKCGTPVKQENEIKSFCPGCGAELKPGTIFCGNCGCRVDGQVSYADQEITDEEEPEVIKKPSKMKGIIIALVVTAILAVGGACAAHFLLNPSEETTEEAEDAEDESLTEAEEKIDEEAEEGGKEDAEEETDTREEKNTAEKSNPYSNVQVGDHIEFGSYEQDGDETNGAEPISWEVLDIEDGKALIISDYVLDVMEYHKDDEDITWADCTLRTWLNNDFYEEAFTEKEQGSIDYSEIQNTDNFAFGTEGGEDTEDYVFLLSLDEVKKYYDISEEEFNEDADTNSYHTGPHDELSVMTTAVARDKYTDWVENDCRPFFENLYGDWFDIQGEDLEELVDPIVASFQDTIKDWDGSGSWWLRSPGSDSRTAAGVSGDGSVYCSYSSVYIGTVFVRPALWINLEP